jgi:hypothetical protein
MHQLGQANTRPIYSYTSRDKTRIHVLNLAKNVFARIHLRENNAS